MQDALQELAMLGYSGSELRGRTDRFMFAGGTSGKRGSRRGKGKPGAMAVGRRR